MEMPENGKFEIFYTFQTISSTYNFSGLLRGMVHIGEFHPIPSTQGGPVPSIP